MATGARLEYRWDDKECYAPMRNNETLARLYMDNMAALGYEVPFFNEAQSFGSTDMGNLSQRVPAIHTSVAIAPPGVSEHTAEFAAIAGEERSFERVLEAATALSMTAIDLFGDPAILAKVKREFEK